MIGLIFSIIFIISLTGVVFILTRKMPILSTLPKNGSAGFKNNKLISGVEDKLKKIESFFSDGIVLHKFLSWLKCKIIKAETWVDSILHGIRKKAKENRLNRKR